MLTKGLATTKVRNPRPRTLKRKNRFQSPEPVADDNEGRVGGAAQVPNHLADQLLEFHGHGLHKVLSRRRGGRPRRRVPVDHPSSLNATCGRGTRRRSRDPKTKRNSLLEPAGADGEAGQTTPIEWAGPKSAGRIDPHPIRIRSERQVAALAVDVGDRRPPGRHRKGEQIVAEGVKAHRVPV